MSDECKTSPPYPSGCEIFAHNPPRYKSSTTIPSRFQQIQQAYIHSSQFFSITYLNNCAYGAIALADIPKNTLILDEPPLIPCDVLEEILKGYETGELKSKEEDSEFVREYYLKENGVADEDEVDKLIGMIWSMHDQYALRNDDEYGRSKRIWGINYSNGFYNSESTCSTNNASTNISLFRPTLHFIAAKLNHSCRPNVGYDFSSDNQRVFTTRNIQKGEQLFHSYSDIVYHEPAWVRRLFLKQKYHFDCQCTACAGDTNSSDLRRGQMKDIAISLSQRIGATFLYDRKFDDEVRRITGECDSSDDDDSLDWTLRQTSSLTDGKLKPTKDDLFDIMEYMKLCQEEGLDHDMLHCLELAFDLATFLNDSEHLHHIGSRCLELYEMSKGEKHKLTKKFRKKMQKFC